MIAYESQQIDILAGGILFLIFLVIFGSGYLAEDRKRTGGASISKWYAISSFITAFLGIVLSLMSGIVGLPVLSILVVNCLIATAFLIFTN